MRMEILKKKNHGSFFSRLFQSREDTAVSDRRFVAGSLCMWRHEQGQQV